MSFISTTNLWVTNKSVSEGVIEGTLFLEDPPKAVIDALRLFPATDFTEVEFPFRITFSIEDRTVDPDDASLIIEKFEIKHKYSVGSGGTEIGISILELEPRSTVDEGETGLREWVEREIDFPMAVQEQRQGQAEQAVELSMELSRESE